MRQVVVSVDGMSCRHCVRSVSAQVTRVVSTGTFTVDLAQGCVVVEGEVTPEEVVAAVERAGFAAQISGERDIPGVGPEPGQEVLE